MADKYTYGKEHNLNLQRYSNLETKLRANVCILYILRRHEAYGKNRFRRMLCTNSYDLLNSLNGKIALRFMPASRAPTFNPREKNLIITWDILMQDWRCINMDECYLNYEYPVVTQDQKDKFWSEMFNKTFYLMSTEEKFGWMNKW